MDKVIKLASTDNDLNRMEAVYCISNALTLKNKEITKDIAMKGGVEALCYALNMKHK